MKEKIIKLPKPLKSIQKINITNLSKPDLDRIKSLANFTEDEEKYFDLRAKGKSNVAISIAIGVAESTLYLIRRRVYNKINSVI